MAACCHIGEAPVCLGPAGEQFGGGGSGVEPVDAVLLPYGTVVVDDLVRLGRFHRLGMRAAGDEPFGLGSDRVAQRVESSQRFGPPDGPAGEDIGTYRLRPGGVVVAEEGLVDEGVEHVPQRCVGDRSYQCRRPGRGFVGGDVAGLAVAAGEGEQFGLSGVVVGNGVNMSAGSAPAATVTISTASSDTREVAPRSVSHCSVASRSSSWSSS